LRYRLAGYGFADVKNLRTFVSRFEASLRIPQAERALLVRFLHERPASWIKSPSVRKAGLSYEIYTRTVEPGARPITLQPDGDLTINYLDTHGLPDL
jgi:hypothetical protein